MSDDDDNPQSLLTNEDFRRYISTPRATAPKDSSESEKPRKPPKYKPKDQVFEAKTPRQQLNDGFQKSILAQLSRKYRDRARERRENLEKDEINCAETSSNMFASARASNVDPAAKRRQLIEESKYLGGDMGHTHLVKGLDYALLSKIRAEIAEKDDGGAEDETDDEDRDALKSDMARALVDIVVKSARNRRERFAANRVSYVVDLDEKGCSVYDIPTTLLKSTFEKSHESEVGKRDSEAGDLVIGKLIEIWTNIWEGKSGEKTKDTPKPGVLHPDANKPIFEDDELADYGDDSKTLRELDRGTESYFKKDKDPKSDEKAMSARINEAISAIGSKFDDCSSKTIVKKSTTKKIGIANTESYAECYPGTAAEQDVNVDSDDDSEPDFEKTDDSKKSQMNRFDFESGKDYSDYMSKREVHPKAAFQFGIKPSDGRRTRRNQGVAQKRKLDREWQQISKIIEKRKHNNNTPADN